MDLSTRYLGLELRNPLVASASPLSSTVDGVRRLADAGTESFGEALSYFPADADASPGPRRYLDLLERAAAAVDIPVIASLNGVTPGGWTDYACALEQAGAAAIELNIYHFPADPLISGR